MMCTAASAQATEADIAARLVHKPLLLRGFWAGDKLRFHADGTPARRYAVASFTESAIDVRSVRLGGHDLTVEGQRVGFLFEKDGQIRRVPLVRGGRGSDKSPETIKIEIEGSADGDLTKTLDAVFADNLSEIASTLPEPWQVYARQHFVEAAPGSNTDAGAQRPPVTGDRPLRVGGNVRPPRVLSNVDPEFSETARALRISGNSQIYLWVEPDGSPSHLRIARPAGLGLDEKALEAVSRYKFTPASRNGTAVTVEIYIEVNFQIF
jgi:TonB family protein